MTSSRTSKRKALQPAESMVRRHVSVEPLRIEDMVVNCSGYGKLYFKRLKYRGYPKLDTKSKEFRKGAILTDAGRDDFIRDAYRLLNFSSSTSYSIYGTLVVYLRWIDETNQAIPEEGYLGWELLEAFVNWSCAQRDTGNVSFSKCKTYVWFVSWILRQTGRSEYTIKLPSIRGMKAATTHISSLDLETELKPTIRLLFRAYNKLLIHFNQGTTPDFHPLYDKELFEAEANKRGIKGRAYINSRLAFRGAMAGAHPNKHIIEIAMMLTYMFTGMNTKPLSDMRIANVSFREVQGGKYIFYSVKGRAGYQEQDNAIGFSKYAKQFIESWIDISKRISNGKEDAYLFPHFKLDGSASSFSETAKTPQASINKMLARMGMAQITPSKLRKTKSDTLYRVTESVYLVAMSNNNSMEITARTYIHGTEKEHETNLSAAMSAKFDIAKGKDVNAAVDEAKHKYGDILDDYEYQRLRKGQDRSHEARTPTGARCNDSRQGAASIIKKSLKRAGINTDESETACTDFLACFDCAQHAFVTDVDDIWLMLSFKDTLQQLQQTPAINSMPERKYTDLFNLVDSVLNGLRVKNETNYHLALEKLKGAPHPLYATVYSLNDLLETFS